MNNTKKLVVASLLIAVQIVLTRLVSIEVSRSFRISVAFIALAVNGALMGPVIAGMSSVVADILGFVLKPTGGFFPGFTLTALITGYVYGYFLHRREIKLKDIAMAAFLNILVQLFLNSLWLNMLLGKSYMFFVKVRFPGEVAMFVVQVALMKLLLPKIIPQARRALGMEV